MKVKTNVKAGGDVQFPGATRPVDPPIGGGDQSLLCEFFERRQLYEGKDAYQGRTRRGTYSNYGRLVCTLSFL